MGDKNKPLTEMSWEEVTKFMQEGFEDYFKNLDLKHHTICQSVEGYWTISNRDRIPVVFMGDDFLEALMGLEVYEEKVQTVKLKPTKPYYRKNERW